jgi:hypothetical protein
MGFLSSYLNLLREDVYKSYQANEGEIYNTCFVAVVSKRFRLEERRVDPQNAASGLFSNFKSLLWI